MKETENIDVEFRYVGLPMKDYEIPGICLCYPNKKSAINAYEIIHEYITSRGGSRGFRVEFVKDNDGTYIFMMSVLTPMNSSDTNITGVNPLDIKKLINGLENVAYYIILAGYTEDGEFKLLPHGEYNMLKNDLILDGKTIFGKKKFDVDWVGLVDL